MTARNPTPDETGVPTEPKKGVHFAVPEATVRLDTIFNFRAPITGLRFARRRSPATTPLTTDSPEERADRTSADRTKPKLTLDGLVCLLFPKFLHRPQILRDARTRTGARVHRLRHVLGT